MDAYRESHTIIARELRRRDRYRGSPWRPAGRGMVSLPN